MSSMYVLPSSSFPQLSRRHRLSRRLWVRHLCSFTEPVQNLVLAHLFEDLEIGILIFSVGVAAHFSNSRSMLRSTQDVVSAALHLVVVEIWEFLADAKCFKDGMENRLSVMICAFEVAPIDPDLGRAENAILQLSAHGFV